MSIPNLIKSILSIHDLQSQVKQIDIELKTTQSQLLLTDVALTQAQDHIKELEECLKGMSELNDQVEELKEEQTALRDDLLSEDSVNDLIEKAVSELDLSEEVGNCIENLNISIKVC